MLCNAIGLKPTETYKGQINLMAVYRARNFKSTPDFKKVIDLTGQGLIVTAPGLHHDFVSRYFCPKYGINEDP